VLQIHVQAAFFGGRILILFFLTHFIQKFVHFFSWTKEPRMRGGGPPHHTVVAGGHGLPWPIGGCLGIGAAGAMSDGRLCVGLPTTSTTPSPPPPTATGAIPTRCGRFVYSDVPSPTVEVYVPVCQATVWPWKLVQRGTGQRPLLFSTVRSSLFFSQGGDISLEKRLR